MKIRTAFTISVILFITAASQGLESEQILVIVNSDIEASVQLAKYYCKVRKVPKENVLNLRLGEKLADEISRDDYEEKLAEPVRKKLLDPEFYHIRCLVTTYGVPFRVGKRGQLKGYEEKLKQLKQLLGEEKARLEQMKEESRADERELKEAERKIALLQLEIDRLEGKETNASVDSELSMVLCGEYELYRWQVNELRSNVLRESSKMFMVSRLDGPSFEIAKGLVDKALSAEKKGLVGNVYIDRGYSEVKKDIAIIEQFDRSLEETASMFKAEGREVVEESTAELFEPNECPLTSVYCGWHSLKKYVDAFDFVDGAIGIHISSLEAVNLRDANSSQWCPAMLTDGVSVTIGAVAEPYLHTFPEPKAFFRCLLDGLCLAEAYYYTKPYNSWQLILLGDPLYKPFKKPEN